MSLFKKLFGRQNPETPDHQDFSEGDVIYAPVTNGYDVYKILRIDEASETLHVTKYQKTQAVPTTETLDALEVLVWHLPIDIRGYKHTKFVANTAVTDDELIGYFEYLRQTRQIELLGQYGKRFYQEAYRLTDDKQYDKAIQQYSRAIQLLPYFYEAMDNRGFCYMDCGQWHDAIASFSQSLGVKADNTLALFSIGKCHLWLRDFPNAKVYFERTLEIDGNHAHARKFLEHTEMLIQSNP